ncbi:hypothetical protein GMOD_00000779 [Pyrenophora seminiperda CCB06]|uniref:Uncharacterized protein n=1 Tax=Pyrenophora seminiperda CCB06 TaxID=1302712 RepID=A0A3M7M841_9PLEO|nr:hypothetical protein GMOD_00000779 [Pyrenophora seminiperda CCB06]
MATSTATALSYSNSRKYNWANDDEDDFNIDSWKASVDNSVPTVAELGPLSCVRGGEAEDEKACTLSVSRPTTLDANSSTCTDEGSTNNTITTTTEPPTNTAIPDNTTPDSTTPKMASSQQLPELSTRLPILSLTRNRQVVAARYEILARAIGQYYEGKETCDLPAYPELSDSKGDRYRYAHQFQEVRLSKGRGRAEVYRSSPLANVTHIDDAETMDEVSDGEYEEEELDAWEMQQIAAFEAEEDEAEAEAGDEKENPVQQMPDHPEGSEPTVSERLSREDLEHILSMCKVKGQEDKEDIGEDDVDSWELSDEEEEKDDHFVCDSTPSGMDERIRDISSITRPMGRMGSYFLPVHDNEASDEDDLNFNDVVFGTEDEPSFEESASCHSLGSLQSSPGDEGYGSTSPPISYFPDHLERPASRRGFSIPTGKGVSLSSARRSTQFRHESMETLEEFRESVRGERRFKDVFEMDRSSDEGDEEERELEADALPTSDDVISDNIAASPPSNDTSGDNIPSMAAASSLPDDHDVETPDTTPHSILDLNYTFPLSEMRCMVPPSLPVQYTEVLSIDVADTMTKISTLPLPIPTLSPTTHPKDTISDVPTYQSPSAWFNPCVAVMGFAIGGVLAAVSHMRA